MSQIKQTLCCGSNYKVHHQNQFLTYIPFTKSLKWWRFAVKLLKTLLPNRPLNGLLPTPQLQGRKDWATFPSFPSCGYVVPKMVWSNPVDCWTVIYIPSSSHYHPMIISSTYSPMTTPIIQWKIGRVTLYPIISSSSSSSTLIFLVLNTKNGGMGWLVRKKHDKKKTTGIIANIPPFPIYLHLAPVIFMIIPSRWCPYLLANLAYNYTRVCRGYSYTYYGIYGF